jgi:tRNA (adenine57-N1/adenine58-N1)-methyltransferase
MEIIEDGSDALLVMNRHTYLVKVKKGARFHTHRGFIELENLIGMPFGSWFTSNTGERFVVMRPSLKDYVSKFSRRTQIIYPKDSAVILLWSDVHPGSKVLEAGIGSGGLTVYLAAMVADTGKVYGYDINPESLETTKKNLERVGLLNRVELRLGDVTHVTQEEAVDAVVFDLPSPWLAVKVAKNWLKSDGFFVSFSPTIDQIEKTVIELRLSGFVCIEAFEVMQRYYKVAEGATRPEGFPHTGYMVSARNSIE